MSSIGKVSATQNNPTSADEFSFWLTDDVVIAPFDMVAVPNANKSVTIGVIKEIYHNTDSINHIASYVAHDFGKLEGDATTPRIGTNYAIAEVLSNDSEVYMPLRDGQVVRFATEEEIKSSLGIDSAHERPGHVRIPAGYITMSNNTTVPVSLDSAFLLGPESAHLNISGISGLATKTSYAMFLLQAVAQKMKDKSIATIIFNVKGDDLLYIDEPSKDLKKQVVEDWKRCMLEAMPFTKTQYFFPYKNKKDGKRYANTWCKPDTLEQRQQKGTAWNYIYTFDHDKEKIDLLLSNIDDPNFTIESIINEIVNGKQFEDVHDWKALNDQVSRFCNTGHKENIPVGSWRRFKRLLSTIVKESTSGIFQDAQSQAAERKQVFLSDKVERIAPGDTYVVDIAELPESEKCLVFGDVIRTVYKLKTEGSETCPDRIVVFVDELNKYAPENIKNSPIIGDLLEITERGRSLGVVLFSAEQFRSGVHSRVKGNCGTNVYGRTNAVEIALSDYRYLPKTYSHMMTRLKKGHLIIQHPVFRSLMKIAFPMPAYHQPTPSE